MRYLTLGEALVAEEAVTGLSSQVLGRSARLGLLDSALHPQSVVEEALNGPHPVALSVPESCWPRVRSLHRGVGSERWWWWRSSTGCM